MPVHVTSHMTISVSDMVNSQTCRTIYQGQSLLLCLRRSKGLSTRLHRVSQSHQLARPLLQVQLPSPQRAPLRLRLLKSYVNVLACNMITLCFSRPVLNSDYIKQFSFLCVCVLLLSLLMFPADWLMFSGCKINFFSGSHLAPKYFEVVANSKKLVVIMTHTQTVFTLSLYQIG